MHLLNIKTIYVNVKNYTHNGGCEESVGLMIMGSEEERISISIMKAQ